jgi:type I restriction enzyme S subunit
VTSSILLPWIGDFKSEWRVVPNKAVIKPKKQSVGVKANEYDLLSLTKQGVIVRDLDEGGKFPENFDSYQRVEPGNLVTCLFDVEETPRTIGISIHSGMITGAYDVFEFRGDVNPRFFEYYYLALDQRKGLKYFYSGLRNVIRTPVFLSIPMPLPPLAEQDEIVQYLDRELRQIDDLVDKQIELSRLLLERRKKLITETLISGLDSSVSMTESKYDWLPKYPSHWSLSKISNLHKFKTGGTPASGNEEFYGGEHAWATIGDLQGKQVTSTAQNLTSAGVSSASMSEVPKGSLLFSFKLSVGQVAIAGQNMYTNEAIAAFAPNPRVELAWAYYAYSEFIPHFTSWNIYGARLMNQDLIRSARVPLPPLEEQRAIAGYLDFEVAKLDLLSAKAAEMKQSLLQRRISLISAAVTGKLKIQGVN